MLNVEHTVAKAGNPPDFSIAKDRSDIGHWPHRCGVFDSNALLFRGVGILVHGVGGCFCLISRVSLVWTFVWHWMILDHDSILPRSSQLWSLSWIPNDKCMTNPFLRFEVWCQTSCYTMVSRMNNCNMTYFDLICRTIQYNIVLWYHNMLFLYNMISFWYIFNF